MNFRIKQYPQGFAVEVQKRKWWGKRYWRHFITPMGMDKPWYFSSYNVAESELLKQVKWGAIKESNGHVDFLVKVKPSNNQ